MKKIIAIVLTLILILGSISMVYAGSPLDKGFSDTVKEWMKIGKPVDKGFSDAVKEWAKKQGGQPADKENKGMDLSEVVEIMKDYIDGEVAFDYVSYVYMGWRTTGGPWQNHVIRDFIVNNLEDSGYVYSDHDMSSAHNKDYVWVQQDDSESLFWAPQYASLEVVSEADEDLLDTFNVVSYAFDPTCDIYMDHYGEEYGVESIEDMYSWITEREADGTRTNVVNGLEADLNKRAHLATNTCFTDPSDTPVDEAEGVEGDVVYIGSVASTTIDGKTVYYGTETGLDGNADLEGKVLFSDSRSSTTFNLARQVGAIAIISSSALSSYNNPIIDGEMWYTDSARFASGTNITNSYNQMQAGAPIVIWNLSLDQKAAMHQMLADSAEAGVPVTVKCVSIGDIYPMAIDEGGEGQLTAIAEIAGTTKADERVMIMAHIQEPGACDNASGVGLQLELAIKMKEMIDAGILERPERTITFFWGDEMRFSQLWLNAHPEEQEKVVCTIDLDMVGEDPAKTGGPMRIEKTPDPSAIYNYTLDVLPGEEPYSSDEFFVRLPDSHTLWGAGDVPDVSGLYLNDLYMASTQEVISRVDSEFQVAVCPYEGGSDHTVFLRSAIPSVLTWHFTDYVYHTTVDTLDKVSAREMENVGITSLAAGYFAAIAAEYETLGLMDIVYAASEERFDLEALNTENHFEWTYDMGKDMNEALELEIEVLTAWGTWYIEALQSCSLYFMSEGASPNVLAQESKYIKKVEKLLEKAIDNAEKIADSYSLEAAS